MSLTQILESLQQMKADCFMEKRMPQWTMGNAHVNINYKEKKVYKISVTTLDTMSTNGLSFYSLQQLISKVLLSPFNRWGNWSSVKFSIVQSHITGDDKAEIQTQVCLALKPVRTPHMPSQPPQENRVGESDWRLVREERREAEEMLWHRCQ